MNIRNILPLLAILSIGLFAQRNMDDVKIKTTEVAGGVYLLEGRGGNIGVFSGPDGTFVIDAQFAPLTEKIMSAIQAIHQGPVRFLVNTHWHGDHTGGNENFRNAGATIIAHENVRQRMSEGLYNPVFKRQIEPSAPEARPVITVDQGLTFFLNGDTITATHLKKAHTDGDLVLKFHKANVIHAGDIFFVSRFPYIDVASGGSVKGLIKAVEMILDLCDDQTRLIGGHGKLATKSDLMDYLEVIRKVTSEIETLLAAGKSLDDILINNPASAFPEWGSGFIDADTFTSIAVGSMRSQ